MRRLAVFLALAGALLIVVASALAADPSGGAPGERAFHDPLIQEQIAAERAGEERQGAERSTPQAEAQREDSEIAYADASDAEALDIAKREFGEIVSEPLWRPLELQDGERIDAYLGNYTARVERDDGDAGLLESMLPLRARDDAGHRRLLDPELDEQGSHYEAENPIVETTLAKDAADGVTVDAANVSVRPADAPEGSDARTVENKLFYPNVASDTDFIAAPVATGVATFLQLRSADSPEHQQLAVDMPAGAELRTSGDGGAAVVRGDAPLVTITPPAAWDADGQSVPVHYTVDGNQLTVEVAHAGGDFRYPILVDPVFESYSWSGLSSPSAYPGDTTSWTWTSNRSGDYFDKVFQNGLRTKNILLDARFNRTENPFEGSQSFNDGDFGEWLVSSFRESYIERIDFNNMDHEPNGANACTSVGLYDLNGLRWETGRAYNPANASFTSSPNSRCSGYLNESRHHWVGQNSQPDGAGGDAEGATGNVGVFALVMAGSGRRTSVAKNLLRGSLVYRYDRNDPTLTNPAPQASGWSDDSQADGARKTHTLTASGRDPGLGMKYFNLFGPNVDAGSGDGSPDVQTKTHPCAGDRRARCPVDWSQALSYKLDEGRNELRLVPYDVLGQSSASQSWTQRIDRSAPTLELSGSLKQNENRTLREDSYTLQLDARDGDAATKAQERSGMKRLEVFVDDESEPSFSKERDCPDGSCPMSESWELDSAEVGNGEHTIKVVATDQLGHRQTQSFDVTVDYDPRTGELRQYQFEDQQLTDRSSLRTNVGNGNALYRAEDLKLAGTGIELVVDRYWNGLSERASDFGRGWSIGTGSGVRLEELDDSVRFFGPSGYVLRFKHNGSGYDAPSGLDAELTKRSDDGFDLDLLQSEETYKFDAQGRFQEHTDRNGHKLRFAYRADDKLDTITDTQDRVTRFAYNSEGLVSSMTDSSGREWRYEYEGGNLVRFFDPEDSDTPQTRYVYDPDDRLTDIYDQHAVDSNADDDEDYNHTRIGYDGDSRRIAAIARDADGRSGGPFVTGYRYDTRADTCTNDSDLEGPHESTVVTDPRDNQTTYCVDRQERVDKTRDAEGGETKRQYNTRSNIEQYTSPTGEVTSFQYDEGGDRLERAEGPGGSATEFGYDAGNDSFRPNSVTDPQGNQKTYQYDGAGNLTTISANTGQDAEELIELDYYDEGKRNGLLKSSTDGANHRTDYEYDDQGNLTREIPPGSGGSDPEQGATEYSYDNLSRIDAVKDGNDVRRTLAYDSLDRTTRTSYPDDTYTRAVYDGAGNSVERADGKAGGGLLGQDDEQVDRYAYDARNLTTQEDLRDGALGDDRVNEYTYDAAGNLETLRDAGGTTTYGYDARNLVESLQEPERGPNDPRQPFDFDYQEDGQLLRTKFPNGVVQQNGYDKDRLTSIKAGPAGNPSQLVDLSYSYDDPDTDGDKMADLRYKVEDHAQNITTRYQYDNLNRLKEADNSGSNSDRWFYDYNKATNLIRSEREEGDPATRYLYNNSSELRCVYRGAEQDGCPADGTEYDYDQNGNQTSVEGGNSSTYNNRNQTTRVTPAGAEPLDLGYAGVDQKERLKRGGTEYTDTLLGLGRERNTLLGTNLLEGSTFYTRDDSGTPLGQRTPQGDFYYLADSIGSVVALTGENGALAGRYRYDPYGQVVENSEAVPNAIRFAGEYYDAETKLYKIGVRYYDPSVGRWTQKDPLNLFQDPRQGNRYAYAGADPVNRIDPTGQSFFDSQLDTLAAGALTLGAAALTTATVVACVQGTGPAAVEICPHAAVVGYSATSAAAVMTVNSAQD